MNIILVLFPENANHFVQPFNISVLKIFKASLKKEICNYIIGTSFSYLTKREAVVLLYKSLEEGVMKIIDNIVSGFRFYINDEQAEYLPSRHHIN